MTTSPRPSEHVIEELYGLSSFSPDLRIFVIAIAVALNLHLDM